MQLVSVMGAGLLLGTALSVIIPEGVATLNMAYTAHTAHAAHQEHGHTDSGGPTPGEEEHHENPGHHLIGVALVLGFIFMLIIDQVASSRSGPRDPEGGRGSGRGAVSWTATLGLVVHAAADGIALGAAATTNQTDVEMIVFLAIMLHKAPASFGLVTYLLHEGLERNRVRKHLLVFSVAAPSAAVLTFLLLQVILLKNLTNIFCNRNILQGSGRGSMDTIAATGVAMLFSAGTFLYVATVHVLPEVTGGGHSHGPGPAADKQPGFSKAELFMLILGAVLPLFMTVGHHH